jgi:prepilin-type N-terminal cleavage/methylation domain-containing protein
MDCDRASGQAGFTIVELVIVMTLMALIAMISAPRLIGTGTRGAIAARELQAAVRHAVKLAIGTGCTIQVAIAGDTYTVSRAAGGDCVPGTVIDPRTNLPGYTGSVPGGIASSEADFLFDGLGRVTNLASAPIAQVTLTASGLSITVEGETGFVHLQ